MTSGGGGWSPKPRGIENMGEVGLHQSDLRQAAGMTGGEGGAENAIGSIRNWGERVETSYSGQTRT
jgi:hypothetical protein